MKKTRPIIHRVPVRTNILGGPTIVGMRHFGTMTEAKKFAKDQCLTLGHKGYMIESLPREEVARILDEYAPIPDHFRR